ncbi:MAG: hypothetical protein ACJ76I_06350 [Gaiellaceae bacterium]
MLTREQVDVLAEWGAGLEGSGASDELQAAGRAIRLLVDYIEGLERNRWHERGGVSDQTEDAPVDARLAPGGERSLLGALAKRIGTQP